MPYQRLITLYVLVDMKSLFKLFSLNYLHPYVLFHQSARREIVTRDSTKVALSIPEPIPKEKSHRAGTT